MEQQVLGASRRFLIGSAFELMLPREPNGSLCPPLSWPLIPVGIQTISVTFSGRVRREARVVNGPESWSRVFLAMEIQR